MAPHPDEGTIHSWLDGELPDAEARTLTAHLEGCADCRDAVAEARGLVAASARIVRALDDGPGGVHVRPAATPPAASRTSDGRAGEPAPGSIARPPDASPAHAGGMRPMDVARASRPAGAPRRWRLPAIAAVGLMAVGTTLVLQRGGPLPPLAEQGVPEIRSEAVPAAQPRAGAAESSELAGAPGSPAGQSAVAAGAASSSAGTSAGAPRTPSAAPPVAAPPVAAPPLPPLGADAAVADRAARRDSGLPARGTTALLAAPAGAAARPRSTQPETADVSAPPLVVPPSPDVARAVGPVLSGRVVTSAGRPVASALVTLPGVAQSAVTDSLGRFRLSGLPTGEHVAVVRGIGYEQRRLPLHVVPTGDSVVTVALEPERFMLEEMVVTGAAAADEPRKVGMAIARVGPPPAAPAPAPQPPTTAPAAPSLAGAVPDALARRLAGCYRLELGGEASAGRDSAEVALPGWLHLLATPSARRPGWLRLEPVLPGSAPAAGST
ncbi:MAG: carboxypeptidase regulatory-like domain-containing protein, partial [Gemmatimonadaceae bacterium]